MRFVLLTNKNPKELEEFINKVYDKGNNFGNKLEQKFQCEFILKNRNSGFHLKVKWFRNGKGEN